MSSIAAGVTRLEEAGVIPCETRDTFEKQGLACEEERLSEVFCLAGLRDGYGAGGLTGVASVAPFQHDSGHG